MTCPGSHAQPNKMVLKEGASLVAQLVKNLPAMQESWVRSLGWEDSLEKGMATHSSILAWRIPMNRGAWWATLHGVAKSQTKHSTAFKYSRLFMWSTGEGNGKPLQYSCLENPMNSMKRQNDRIPKKELPRSLSAQYATGDQWRSNSRKNEGMEPKQK